MLGALLLAPAAVAKETAPVYDGQGNLIGSPFVPETPPPRLTEASAIAAARANRRIADWVARYPQEGLVEDATRDEDRDLWTVKIWADGEAGQIVLAKVEDDTSRVTEAWTGPQVAWTMARGSKGSFGRKINDTTIWLVFCGAFLLGLADLRRPLSIRNLDLLVLLSFSVSLWFFNEGEIFTSVPLAYPPLLYLLARMAWLGRNGKGSRSRAVWPVWALAAATVFLAGFKVGLNVQASNVIDVGLASVAGAQRIAGDGQAPYGNMPTDEGEPCGPANSDGYVRDHIQTNGRCEAQVTRGDTYGPATYLAYVPGYAAFGWSGKWDQRPGTSWGNLPAAHFTSIAFDLLAIAGLVVVGRRFGGVRLGVTLAFAWAAYPFTQYVSSSNSNDAIMPVLLIWGFALVTSGVARGLFVGLASWAKFASFLLVPLWASYPSRLERPRGIAAYAVGLVLACALSLWVVLLEPEPAHAARLLWDRTLGFQLSRGSPFSIWDWGRYGYVDLSLLQRALEIGLVLVALALAVVRWTRTPIRLAALTAALLIGFEIVLTHWFYLYIPWFFPFVAFALLAPEAARLNAAEAPVPDREIGALAAFR